MKRRKDVRNVWMILFATALGFGLTDTASTEDDDDIEFPQDSTVIRAPFFELNGLDGGIYRLSDYLGSRPIIVWFTNLCGGCQANIPRLDSVYKAQVKPQAELLAISLLGDDQTAVAEISEKLRFDFPILFDPAGKTCEDYIGLYVEAFCPATNLFVIDREGIIKYEIHFPGHPEAEAISALRKLIDQEYEKSGAKEADG
jgi:peroxiredoxin